MIVEEFIFIIPVKKPIEGHFWKKYKNIVQ